MSRAKRSSVEPPPRTSKAPPSLTPRAIEDETVFVEGAKADFEAFLTAAHGMDAAKVQTFRGDASLAYHNVVAGLGAVLAEKAAVVASKLDVDWVALDELPRIALGLAYAVARVEGHAGPQKTLQQTLTRGRVLYDIGMTSADALAKSGDVPLKDVTKLRASGTPLNLARALLKLSDFYTLHRDRVKGKTPFTSALVREAAKLGSELLTTVKPTGTPRTKDKSFAEAQRDRDCLAALLVERYEALERVAGSRWGRSLGEHVPALQSRVQKARAKKAPAATKTDPATKPG